MTPEEITTCFESLATALASEAWYKQQNWQYSQHVYPPQGSAEGVTFQLFKTHWFNQAQPHAPAQQGIHLETYLDFKPAKQKKTVLTLHLLHLPFIPGTQLKRNALAKEVVDVLRSEIGAWPGYVFRAGAYGQQPFALTLDGNAPGFEARLKFEFSRLAQAAGPIIERALVQLGIAQI